MITQELVDYILRALQRGYSEEKILATLLQGGWSADGVREALDAVRRFAHEELALPLPPKLSTPASQSLRSETASHWRIDVKHFSASQILLYLGGLVVVIAGISYVGMNWEQWSPFSRIFAVFLPMMICFISGLLLWFREAYKKQGISFLFVGALLIPTFLIVAFDQLGVFSEAYSLSFNLTVTFISFIAYFVFSFTFRYPLWSFLYHAAGLFVYFFLMQVLGVRDFFDHPGLAWLMLIPGSAYVLLDFYYTSRNEREAARYSHILGVLVLAFVFIRLFFETFDTEQLTWLLVVVGILYFALGIYFERRNRYSRALCFLGAMLAFFAVFRLGSEGIIVDSFIGEQDWAFRKAITGWSTVISGFMGIFFAWTLGKLRDSGFFEPGRYYSFFNFFGALGVLGGVWSLGLNGRYLGYETLLLFVSLGFIFWSVARRSRSYLYLGTLFLIIYIFSMGGEYFEGNVGWPITLTIAGLLSMGIGLIIERLRRRYFQDLGKI